MHPFFAYIDPGSGSAAYQMVLAGFLGVAFFARRMISTIRAKLTGRRPGSAPPSKSSTHVKS